MDLMELLAQAPTNWGRFGEADEVGGLNFLTPQEILRGIASVKQGKVFTLGLPMGNPQGDPVWPGRSGAVRLNTQDKASYLAERLTPLQGGLEYADDYITMYLQGSTQIDALGHTWYNDQLWNGYDAKETIDGLSKASVFPISQRGIVGRAVLLDIARYKGVDALASGEEVTLHDLLNCAQHQNTTIEPHDIVLIRTGWFSVFFKQGPEVFYRDFMEPGLTYRPELVNWFHETEIPALGTDTIANERTVHPDTGIVLPLHAALMRNLGVVFNEILWLEDLAEDAVQDGQYTFLYVGAPIKVAKATGSPVNPVVIK